MSRIVHVDFRKWMTRLHWQFDMYWLDEDEWGTWLWTPPGSTAKRGDDPAKTFNHLNLKLIAPGEWWTAIWNDSGRFDLYIDTITPASWNGDRVTMIDLDLDIMRRADGSVIIEDEDEFELHQDLYAYPQTVIEKARSVTDTLRDRIAAGEEPFAKVGQEMMARAQALAKSHRPNT